MGRRSIWTLERQYARAEERAAGRLQRHRKILDWSDERDGMGRDGDPIMVTLVPGFAYYDNDADDAAAHVLGFYTVKEAMAAVRAARPCTCNRCRRGDA